MTEKDRKFYKSLCKKIKEKSFAWERYCYGGNYYGRHIGTIRTVGAGDVDGYKVIFYSKREINEMQYDAIKGEVYVDGKLFDEWYNSILKRHYGSKVQEVNKDSSCA